MNLEMKVSELSKKERIAKEKRARILKEMENRIKATSYIEFNDDVKNILEYLYDKCNRKGQVYMTMRDIVCECNLGHLGDDKDEEKKIKLGLKLKPVSEIIEDRMEAIRDILFRLEDVILSSVEDLIGITEEQHYNELIILELVDDFR